MLRLEPVWNKQSSKSTLKINDGIVYKINFMYIPSKKNVMCHVYDKIATMIWFGC